MRNLGAIQGLPDDVYAPLWSLNMVTNYSFAPEGWLRSAETVAEHISITVKWNIFTSGFRRRFRLDMLVWKAEAGHSTDTP